MDARRNLSGVCGRWYPVILDLHRFFIAISRAVVNHDGFGGTAPDPMVWSAGSMPKRRRLVHAVRDLALLPGPPAIWLGEWVAGPSVTVGADDVAQWPYTPGLLVKWVSFLPSLHWPANGFDLGVGGISYVELLIMYELWAGERLVLEKAHPRYLRAGRPISVSAVPVRSGIDIWRSCRFIGAMMRSLCLLPGGLGRFVPCSIGANHCRLRHLGWERCCHGLTSRPRESASSPFLDQLLLLFHYPPGSSGALLAGSLPLRYCSSKFASKTSFGVLPVPGHVAGLVSVQDQAALVGGAEVSRRVSGLGRIRFRLYKKTPAHLVGHFVHARPRVWRRLHSIGYPGASNVDCKRRRYNQQGDGDSPVHPQDWCGLILVLRRPTSQVCT